MAQAPAGFVLLVCEPIVPGGVAVYAGSLLAVLRQAGVPHALLTPIPPLVGLLDPAELERVHVVSELLWTAWRPLAFRKIVDWAAEHQVGLVHSLSARTHGVAARLAQALHVPFIVSVHHFQKRGGLRADAGCHGFIAVSESLRENLVNDARIPKELVRVIPAGIAIPPALPRDDPEGTPLVTSIGKLIDRKDFPTFLRAARLILDRFGRECSFVICGDGPRERALRRLARDLRIDKHVTFCHGNAAIQPLLRDTDVYVQCSRLEGFGTMTLQAMAQCTPVIATATGGLLALVKEGETGYLVAPGDVETLVDHALRLLEDYPLRRRMGEAARAAAAASFSLDRMRDDTLALYDEATSVTQPH